MSTRTAATSSPSVVSGGRGGGLRSGGSGERLPGWAAAGDMHLGAGSCLMLSFVTLKLFWDPKDTLLQEVDLEMQSRGRGLRTPPLSHGGPSKACPTLTHLLEAQGMALVISLWVEDRVNGNCLKGVMRAGAQFSWQGTWLRCRKPWIPSPATHSMHGATRLYPHTPVVREGEPEV